MGARKIANLKMFQFFWGKKFANVNLKIAAKCNASLSSLGFMIEKGYSGRNVRDLNHLRETLTAEWDNLSQDVIDAAVAQFRPRLRACVANTGGHFEHQFN